MEDFYLTLPSNSSMKEYPKNVPGHYYTKLPQTIDLSGKNYEIGLAEIQFPNTYSNVEAGEMLIIVQPDGPTGLMALELPQGLYDTAEIMISSLNALVQQAYLEAKINKKTLQPQLFYDRSSKRVTLKIYDKDARVRFSPQLAKILRMSKEEMKGPRKYQSTGVVDIHKDSNAMYIYCDLVRHRQVGDTMVPLLRVVPATEKNADVTYRIFEKPHY